MKGESSYPSVPIAPWSRFILRCYHPWLLGCNGCELRKGSLGVSSYTAKKPTSRRRPRQGIAKVSLQEADCCSELSVIKEESSKVLLHMLTEALKSLHSHASCKACVRMLLLLFPLLFTINPPIKWLCPFFLSPKLFFLRSLMISMLPNPWTF